MMHSSLNSPKYSGSPPEFHVIQYMKEVLCNPMHESAGAATMLAAQWPSLDLSQFNSVLLRKMLVSDRVIEHDYLLVFVLP